MGASADALKVIARAMREGCKGTLRDHTGSESIDRQQCEEDNRTKQSSLCPGQERPSCGKSRGLLFESRRAENALRKRLARQHCFGSGTIDEADQAGRPDVDGEQARWVLEPSRHLQPPVRAVQIEQADEEQSAATDHSRGKQWREEGGVSSNRLYSQGDDAVGPADGVDEIVEKIECQAQTVRVLRDRGLDEGL